MERLQIFYTSDTHGHIFPVNYGKAQPEASGLLCIAAQLQKDGNTLVLDGGDSLQGTPLTQYYLTHVRECPVHPVAAGFNAMGLDYFTLGNHDFNFGYEALASYLEAMEATCLCANVEDLGGRLKLSREVVHTLENGLRVGITGVVTDFVNVWEQPRNLEQLRITDAFTAASKAYHRLRPQCDVCICIYHGGFEEDLATGELLSDTGENLACKLARELGFDLLLTGHQHMPVEGLLLHGTYAVQPPANAGRYLQITGELEDASMRFSSAFCQVGEVHLAEPYQTLLPLEEKVQQWLDQPIGTLSESIAPEGKLEAALHGSRLADLFNQVQLEVSGADISCTALGNDPVGLASPVTVRGITAAYTFANTLMVLEVTEEVLRTVLERCASYLTLEGGSPRISDAFLKPKVEHYNYDFFGGISYTFDLRKPVGQRVVQLAWPDGTPLGKGPFKLCTSNYRATGTGGYEVLRSCPVLYRGGEDIPELITAHIRRCSPIAPIRRAQMKVFY